MNFLTQIVPGLRDTRVPLAVGVIWAIGAWLVYPVARATKHGPILEALVDQWSALPTPMAYGASLFGLYVLGIILEVLGRLVTNLVSQLVSAMVPAIVILVALGLLCTLFSKAWIAALVIFVFLAYQLLRWRLSNLTFAQFFEVLRQSTIQALVIASTNITTSAFYPLWLQDKDSDSALADEIDRALVQNDGRILGQFVGGLSDQQVLRVASQVKLPFGKLGMTATASSMKLLRLVRRAEETPAFVDICRTELLANLKAQRSSRAILVRQCVDITLLREQFFRRSRQIEVILQARQAGLFSDYDRLRAESELRKGLAVPVLALALASLYRWQAYFPISDLALRLTIAGSITVACLMFGIGVFKAREATRLLYSSLQEGVVELSQPTPAADMMSLYPHAGRDYIMMADNSVVFQLKRLGATIPRSVRTMRARYRSGRQKLPIRVQHPDDPGSHAGSADGESDNVRSGPTHTSE